MHLLNHEAESPVSAVSFVKSAGPDRLRAWYKDKLELGSALNLCPSWWRFVKLLGSCS